MSDGGLLGVVLAHGAVAPALVAAAEEITGVRGALIGLSNSDCDRATLERRVAEAAGQRHAVLFVDMPMGSCFHASVRGLREGRCDGVVTGVNLAMLIDFLFHRELPAPEVVARAVSVGGKAIAAPPCPSS